MKAFYGTEKSTLNINGAILDFSLNHLKNIIKRIMYSYFLRDFSLASVNLLLGFGFFVFGFFYGAIAWYSSVATGNAATAGTVMVAALPVIVGVQFLVSFLGYDYSAVPRIPIQRLAA